MGLNTSCVNMIIRFVLRSIDSLVYDFSIDNIFVLFGGRVFQQTIGIPMGTNCAPLLVDLFLHSNEAEFP